MTDYRLMIWEINLNFSSACIMYDFFNSCLNGKEYEYEKMLQIFADSYIEESERKDIICKLSLQNLRKLKEEKRFETHIYLDNGESRSVRLVLMPAINELGSAEIVYFAVVDTEDDLDGMAEIVNRRKRTLLSRLRFAAGLPISHIVVAVVILIVLVLIAFGISGIRQALYEEQAENLMRVMEKMGQNIDMVMENKWDDVHYVASQLCADRFDTQAELLAELESISTYLEMGNNMILAIDQSGMCHYFNGKKFEWIDKSLLQSNEEKVVVAMFPDMNFDMEQMLFTTQLPNAIQVEDNVFTHIVLASDMRVLDDFLKIRDYGSESATYITHLDQSDVYKIDRENPKNILNELKAGKFQYGTSFDKFKMDMDNNNSGCVFVTYDKASSYMAYQKLVNDDWYVLMVVPSQYVGNSTNEFMEYLMIAIGLMALGILVIILLLVYIDIWKSKKEMLHVNDALREATQVIRNAAEAQKNANEAKTRFLSTMSHDIRTPMNVISGMTELAARRVDEAEYVAECLGKIKIASNHLLTLTNDILDISKVETGNITLNISRFSIAALVKNIEEIMKPQAMEKEQQIELKRCFGKIEFLFGDELRINQIFINLISNAIKYTPKKGQVRVDILIEEVDDSKVQLICIVEDNGIGMSEDFQKKMYDVFARETDGRVNKIEGTGLGLAICKQMIDLMGGTIQCESKEGLGTKFTVKILLEKAESLDIAESIENEKKEASLSGMRVLVAEDNDLNWEMIESIFEIYDINADRVENGRQCVEYLEQAEKGIYEAVLMDVQMPILNGKEATKQIRKSQKEWVRNIPIMAMTADAFAEDIEECLEVGMNGHIAKPIDVKKLLCELQKCRS